MTTALTAYGTFVASTTLTSAGTLLTNLGSPTTGTKTTTISTNTGYGEVTSLSSGTWAGGASLPAPSGKGWLLDSTVLEGQTIAAGNWTPTLRFQLAVATSGTITGDIYLRAYKRSSSGVYTLIGTCVLIGQTLSLTATTFSFSATSLPSMAFGVGDKLYCDVPFDATANTTTPTGTTIKMTQSQGVSGSVLCQMVTPGYAPTASGGIVVPAFMRNHRGIGRTF